VPRRNFGRYLTNAAIGLGAVALPAYALMRGNVTAEEQYKRFRDLQLNRQKDLSTPMPSLNVKESYEKFASEKLANVNGPGGVPKDLSFSEELGTNLRANTIKGIGQGVGSGIGETLGDLFIRTPVNEVSGLIKKKFISGPRHRAALEAAMRDDDVLSQTERSKIDNAHATMTRFSPSLAEDPNAVRSYLRSAVMSHGGVDLATIRMLLDAENTRNASRKSR